MRAKKFTRNQVILVRWRDAMSSEGWHEEDQQEKDTNEAEHYSVGRFVSSDKKDLSITESWRVHEKGDYGIGQVMTIPWGVISSVAVLRTLKEDT